MRVLIAVGAFVGALAFAVPAQTENRVFIVASNADGYGVDRCLTTGASCGTMIATAYCQARDFSQARSFRKVDQDEITGGGAKNQACGIGCDELVAIACRRGSSDPAADQPVDCGEGDFRPACLGGTGGR